MLTCAIKDTKKIYLYGNLTKPFSLAELYAKVIALLKRSKGMVGNEVMTAGCIKLDPYRYAVFVNDKEVTLASMEFVILRYLWKTGER